MIPKGNRFRRQRRAFLRTTGQARGDWLIRATAARTSRTKLAAAAGLRARYHASAAQTSAWASTRNLTPTGGTPRLQQTSFNSPPGNRLWRAGVESVQPTIDLDGPRSLRIRIYALIEALDQAGGEASPRPAGKFKGFLKEPLSLAHGNEMLSRGPWRARSTARQMGMVISRPHG